MTYLPAATILIPKGVSGLFKELINTATQTHPFLIEHLDVRYIPHFHEELELVYVLDGELLVTLGSTTYTAQKGDVCIILPNCIHNLFTNIHSKTFVTKIYPIAEINNIKLATNIYSADTPICEELKSYLSAMITENHSKESGYELSVNICASNIQLMIIRKIDHYHIDRHVKNMMIHEGDFLKQVDKFLKQHHTESISLESIAQSFHYTKSYFCRYFKKITGTTFWNYYTWYRLELAVEFMKTNRKSNMTQIALLSNFENVRAFNNAFQKFYRCTPSEYRKMIVNK